VKLFPKIISVALACYLLASSLVSWWLIREVASGEREELQQEYSTVARMAAAEIEKGYRLSQWPFETLERITQIPGFSLWWIVREDGIVHLADRASSMTTPASLLHPALGRPPEQERSILVPERELGLLLEPLSLGEKRWLFVLGYSTRRITEEVRQTILHSSLFSAVLFLFFASLLYLGLHRQSRPLASLISTVAALREGNLQIRAEVQGEDEVAELARSFNLALDHLQRTMVSRDYLDAILENMKEGLVVVDGEGLIETSNQALTSLLGYRKEELYGRPARELFYRLPPEGLGLWEERGGQAEALLRSRDGRIIPVLLGISALPGGSEEKGKSIWVIVDMRQRKEMEEALRRSEERFRIAAQSSSDLIYDWEIGTGSFHWFGDIDGMLGYRSGELSRTVEGWQRILHPLDRERVLAARRRHLEGKAPFREEYRVVCKDGTCRTWIDAGYVLRDELGFPCRMIGACTDVTESRRAQEEREQLILSLQQALASIKTLRGLIPICSRCKKIRDDQGYWQQVEVYVREHSEADFTHGLCPDCYQKYLSDLRRLKERDRINHLSSPEEERDGP
jgi:PAS domain S-box-containing protein